MSLSHPAQRIIALLLQSTGLFTLPTANLAWPCFYSHLPDLPPNAACVYRTTGVKDGRIMPTGRTIIKPGFQLRVRGIDDDTAEVKMYAAMEVIDAVLDETVTIASTTYLIGSLITVGDVIRLGQNKENRRYEYSLNLLATKLSQV